MQITVEQVGNRYQGKLYIEGEFIDSVFDNRPGCCVRILLNRVIEKYGRPAGMLTVDIDGW